MQTLPLITHPHAQSVLAWRDGQALSAAQFLADVAYLRRQLPEGLHMLNACSDRYRFTVGFAAALTAGKTCLLPSTHTPEMIRQLERFAPDTFCLTDDAYCSVALPQIHFPTATTDIAANDDADTFTVPEIDVEQTAAIVFTSGSTGTPVPHRKTWGALVHNVRAGAVLTGLSDGRRHAVVGTVPPQHMYGFESTIAVVLQTGNAMVASNAFFPADICAALASVPQPRMLVSTPVHLRAIAQSDAKVPKIDHIVCATAPLAKRFATQLEATLAAPLMEIYGSTETGQIAIRRTADTQDWRLFCGVRLHQDERGVWASGGHVEQPTLMSDVITVVDQERFLLNGRIADMVNVAGKRSSLAYLNLQLNAIPGVADGVFFMPDEETTPGVTRLCAYVVAPTLTHAALMAALRDRIDFAFMPRPLVLVDALPRNATGKLSRQALLTMISSTNKSGTEARVGLA
ncbi:MAG: AMP-binding protein [Pseudomonadota bacterium]